MSTTTEDRATTIAISGDKLGRTVTIERDERLTLEVGGIPGQDEWTYLTAEEAREVAHALLEAAGPVKIPVRIVKQGD